MAKIQRVVIEGFRGIRNLRIDKLNQINLVVGDNNCGKTSFLEALQLFRPGGDLTGVYGIARLRESTSLMNAVSVYESFICMFPKQDFDLEISVSGMCDDREFSYKIKGVKGSTLVDLNKTARLSHISGREGLSREVETETFLGKIASQYGKEQWEKEVEVNRYSRFFRTSSSVKDGYNIVYLAPFEHLNGRVTNSILQNERYKDICLSALRLFDPDISDMLILAGETNRPVEYLMHNKLGLMPLSTFGDGIKKVLVLANGIAKAAGGILLIDEIETAIHKKYYDDIFGFLIKACKHFDVQVFITTHSLEAIDCLLATQNYDVQDEPDCISVITLKKTENNTYSRVLSGKEVMVDREAFGFEVRL